MLQDNLEINSIIKFNTIKYIIIDSNSIAILHFCLIRIVQQAFCYLSLYLKYYKYCFKYILDSCILSFSQIN